MGELNGIKDIILRFSMKEFKFASADFIHYTLDDWPRPSAVIVLHCHLGTCCTMELLCEVFVHFL
jgi:hypothetical protein